MLSAADPLRMTPRRILIAGVTGSGKTTLARRLGARWDVPRIELDALFHGAAWTPRPAFLDDVRAFAATERWVAEWQYSSQGTDPILLPRAELVVWLDYPYAVVRRRLIRRTLTRSLLRTELWNGNREAPIWAMRRKEDSSENILSWQTQTLHKWTERMPCVAEEHPNLPIVRLCTPRATERWIRALPPHL